MSGKENPNQIESGPFSKKAPDHIGEKVELKSDGKYPESITIGEEKFEFRHENPDQNNALYIRILRSDSPAITENIIIDSNGIIIDHLIYDQRDEVETTERI